VDCDCARAGRATIAKSNAKTLFILSPLVETDVEPLACVKRKPRVRDELYISKYFLSIDSDVHDLEPRPALKLEAALSVRLERELAIQHIC